jgi:hypothetical protein
VFQRGEHTSSIVDDVLAGRARDPWNRPAAEAA